MSSGFNRAAALFVLVAAAIAPGFLWSEQMAMAPAPARAATPRGPVPELVLPPPLPPMPQDEYRCDIAEVDANPSGACARGAPYPFCHWELPSPRAVGHIYATWRNTADEHRSGRPALVSLAIATAAEYARRFPGETLAIGDLDAPGPRHETHESGVDVDLYLPGAMAVENLGQHERVENYTELNSLQLRMHRARVETLARILATCTEGRVRIFYNDEEVQERFLAWYREQGYESEFGGPMQAHNDLHRFHFHVTIPEDLRVLPMTAEDE
jgi:hypothetical protein